MPEQAAVYGCLDGRSWGVGCWDISGTFLLGMWDSGVGDSCASRFSWEVGDILARLQGTASWSPKGPLVFWQINKVRGTQTLMGCVCVSVCSRTHYFNALRHLCALVHLSRTIYIRVKYIRVYINITYPLYILHIYILYICDYILYV